MNDVINSLLAMSDEGLRRSRWRQQSRHLMTSFPVRL